ncbi:HdeD family acid-resistance protein [Oceanidesulfovibrio indonesiensis]|nr:DUF308 domain-containing protein [Oceanidesulfovibrio indonesiensis]
MSYGHGNILILRGAIAILLGLFALLWPSLGLLVLLILVGAYAFMDGLLALWTAWNRRKMGLGHGLAVVEGVAGVLLGAMVLFAPRFTSLALVIAVAIWALLTGVIQLMDAASSLDRSRTGLFGRHTPRWAVALSGGLSVLFGILLLVWPREGMTAIVWIIAIYALAAGIIVVYLGLRIRRRAGDHLK